MKPTKLDKLKCYIRVIKLLLIDLFRIVSAPLMYVVYYRFYRKELFGLRSSEGLSPWRTFVWLYADMEELPSWAGKPTFYNCWKYSAIRNPMFNLCLTSPLYNMQGFTHSYVQFDTRDETRYATSNGVGKQYYGSVLVWYYSEEHKCWIFIWERANENVYQYFGWAGLLDRKFERLSARFEYAFRRNTNKPRQ